MTWPQSVTLASDAARLTVAGAALVLMAVIAGLGERRRRRRRDIDAVGWMPWTTLGFFSAFGAILVFSLAFRAWTAG